MCHKRSAKRWRLTTKKCEGKSSKEWSRAERAKGSDEVKTMKGHTLFKSGTLLWCGTCGAFAETRANRLQKVCVGPPHEQHGTRGVRSQLNRLRAGQHPVTRCRLPQTTWADGSAVKAVHGYARKAGGVEVVDDKFVPYSFDDVRTAKADTPGGKSASEKMRLLRGRVRFEEMRAAREARKENTQVEQK